ncbi:hypothetical protein GCM10027514_15320 [Azotobacter armeniacus]
MVHFEQEALAAGLLALAGVFGIGEGQLLQRTTRRAGWAYFNRSGKSFSDSLTLHAKIANRRKDALHKFSRSQVNQHGTIIVGDVSPTKLAKTTLAKSVLDAGWAN